MNKLVQGGQPYWSFPYSRDSLVRAFVHGHSFQSGFRSLVSSDKELSFVVLTTGANPIKPFTAVIYEFS